MDISNISPKAISPDWIVENVNNYLTISPDWIVENVNNYLTLSLKAIKPDWILQKYNIEYRMK